MGDTWRWRQLTCGDYVYITDEEAQGPVWCPNGHGYQDVVIGDK